jgi:hypothetical protein
MQAPRRAADLDAVMVRAKRFLDKKLVTRRLPAPAGRNAPAKVERFAATMLAKKPPGFSANSSNLHRSLYYSAALSACHPVILDSPPNSRFRTVTRPNTCVASNSAKWSLVIEPNRTSDLSPRLFGSRVAGSRFRRSGMWLQGGVSASSGSMTRGCRGAG